MTPTVIKNCTLYNMDCMEYMKSLPDNAFDLAIVDPPYGWGDEFFGLTATPKERANKRIKKHETKDWNVVPNKEYFDELFRISKNQIIWGGNYFQLPISRGWIFWDKGYENTNNFSAGELAWSNFDMILKKIYITNRIMPHQIKENIHPCQKPVKLYEWLLTNYAKQGDKILDTHLGSGSHAIACNNLGFELVGLELDSDYFKASCERIAKEAQQERLF